ARILDRAAGAAPGEPSILQRQGQARERLGLLESSAGRWAEAESAFRAGVSVLSKLAKGGDAGHLLRLATPKAKLAGAIARTPNRAAAARAEWLACLAVLKKVRQKEPRNVEALRLSRQVLGQLEKLEKSGAGR